MWILTVRPLWLPMKRGRGIVTEDGGRKEHIFRVLAQEMATRLRQHLVKSGREAEKSESSRPKPKLRVSYSKGGSSRARLSRELQQPHVM